MSRVRVPVSCRTGRKAVADFYRSSARLSPRQTSALTDREMQVLVGMSDGKTNEEIARDLFLGASTVKTHAKRLFRKLDARDRAHAVAKGFRAGVLRWPARRP